MNVKPDSKFSSAVNENNLKLEDVLNIQDLQRLQCLFADVSGVASIITHPDGIPITTSNNFCRLCNDIIRKTEKGLSNCLYSGSPIDRYNSTCAVVQLCLNGGLWDAGASISVGGKHIANWLIGQVRRKIWTLKRCFNMLMKLELIGRNLWRP